jgi:hypothetical protein
MPDAKQTPADAAEAAFLELIKKATSQYFDCLALAAGNPDEAAGCRSRYEAALNTFRDGRQTTGEVIARVFPPQ